MEIFIALLIAVSIVIIWIFWANRTNRLIGRTVNNLYRISILLENGEHETAQYALKMMAYQLHELDKKNISRKNFIYIAYGVCPKEKVDKVINLLKSYDDSSHDLDSTGNKNGNEETEKAISNVEAYLKPMGYALTPYGSSVALLEYESAYSEAEIASHIILATLALGVKEAGDDVSKLFPYVYEAKTILSCLKKYRDKGLMRDDIWKSDSAMIWNVVNINEHQIDCINTVLNDPIAGKERLAYKI